MVRHAGGAELDCLWLENADLHSYLGSREGSWRERLESFSPIPNKNSRAQSVSSDQKSSCNSVTHPHRILLILKSDGVLADHTGN